jgi:hypothetical protein
LALTVVNLRLKKGGKKERKSCEIIISYSSVAANVNKQTDLADVPQSHVGVKKVLVILGKIVCHGIYKF